MSDDFQSDPLTPTEVPSTVLVPDDVDAGPLEDAGWVDTGEREGDFRIYRGPDAVSDV